MQAQHDHSQQNSPRQPPSHPLQKQQIDLPCLETGHGYSSILPMYESGIHRDESSDFVPKYDRMNQNH